MKKRNRKLFNKKSWHLFSLGLVCTSLCISSLFADEGTNEQHKTASEKGHKIHFVDVPVVEFIRFVSKISQANFIFDHKDLNFNVTLSTGKAVASEEVVKALVQMLRLNGLAVSEEDNYFVIHKMEAGGGDSSGKDRKPSSINNLIAGTIPSSRKSQQEFFVYKLRYHQGSEIESAIKKIGTDLKGRPEDSLKLMDAIQSVQWVKTTNSLLASGDSDSLQSLKKLIESLDVPLRQVFIEVLVIETDVKKSMEFGLQWAAGGKFKDRFGFGMGNFSPSSQNGFSQSLQGISAINTPTGLNQIPIGKGFDMGVIGDIILHKGKSFLTLGALVSALQADGDSTIVLNQKLIAQDNKNSTIFVGDNIPFTGSVVQTIGQSQQTTANIEYRDIGVNLSITPMLGEGEIITLDLDQEITESVDNQTNAPGVNGIRTTKTNMATHVHVPDRHFLVLSGMVRNAKSYHKAGLPCLGGLPFIGAAFSKTTKHDEKRNVIIFVRPHIIRTFDDYDNITEGQKQIHEKQANAKEFQDALQVLPPIQQSESPE